MSTFLGSKTIYYVGFLSDSVRSEKRLSGLGLSADDSEALEASLAKMGFRLRTWLRVALWCIHRPQSHDMVTPVRTGNILHS